MSTFRKIIDGSYGIRISSPISLSKINNVKSTKITWDTNETQEINVYISLDNKNTWIQINSGDSIPNVKEHDDLSSLNLYIKETFYSSNKTDTPKLKNLALEVQNYYGRRIHYKLLSINILPFVKYNYIFHAKEEYMLNTYTDSYAASFKLAADYSKNFSFESNTVYSN